MLKWILILLVPGAMLLSAISDGTDSAKNVPTPASVQSAASQAPSAVEKAPVQAENKVESVQNTKTAAPETVKVAPKPTRVIDCGEDYYRNVDGNCVHRPSDNPSGASARCRDGSYSYSQNRRGTCSGHGGVATWY